MPTITYSTCLTLSNGELWFATKDGDDPVQISQITRDKNLNDGKDHTLLIKSERGDPVSTDK